MVNIWEPKNVIGVISGKVGPSANGQKIFLIGLKFSENIYYGRLNTI